MKIIWWLTMTCALAVGMGTGPGVSGTAEAAIAYRSAASGYNNTLGEVQYRGRGNADDGSSGNVYPSYPSGWQTGDLLLCIIETKDNLALSMPAGWAALSSATSGATHQAAIYWKIAATGDDTTPTVTHGGDGSIIARILGFYNVDTSNPFDVTNSFTVSPSDKTTEADAIATVTAGAMLVFTAHIANNNSAVQSSSMSGWTRSFRSSTSEGTDSAIEAWYKLTAAVGVQAAINATRGGTAAISHGAQIALRPATSVAGLTIAKPAGTTTDDVMVASIAVRPSDTTISAPSGWTLVRRTEQTSGGVSTDPGGESLLTYYKAAGASEPTSYTWYFFNPEESGGGMAGGILSFSGVDTASPVNAEGGNTTGNSYTHTANAITTTVANAMLVSTHSYLSADAWDTPPAGMTEAVDQSSPPSSQAVGITLEMNYVAQATAGGTNNKSAVSSASGGPGTDYGAAHLLALKPATSTFDHFMLSHGGTGVNCQAENVTFTAHDTSHALTTLSSGTIITLSTSTNHGDWSLVSGTGALTNNGNGSATYVSGVESGFVLALKDTFAETVNINAASGAVTERSGTASADSPFDENLVFAPSGFRFVDASNVETIATQVAGQNSVNYYLQAIRTDTRTGACVGVFASGQDVAINLAFECNNPTTCRAGQQLNLTNNSATSAIQANNNGAALSYASKTMRFGADSKAAFTFNYTDVGQVTLHARYNIPLGSGGASSNDMLGSSNPFVVKPDHFVLSGIQQTAAPNLANPAAVDANGTKFVKAGESFSVTVTAVNANGTATPNYGKEISPEGVKLASALVGGLGLTHNPVLNNSTSFGAFTNGVATGTTFSWDEAGIITLTPSVGDSDYLGAGDVTGTASNNVGRFYPNNFAMTLPSLNNRSDLATCVAPAFSYMAEPFLANFTLTAQGVSGATLQNYAGSFAKLDLATPASFSFGAVNGATNLTTRLDLSAASTGAWGTPAAGSADVSATLAIQRAAAPDGPFPLLDIGIAPQDSDGVALLPGALDLDVDGSGSNDHAKLARTDVRFGRLRLYNAHGSELLALPVPFKAQYYNGSGFVTNSADSCTQVAVPDSTNGGLVFPAGQSLVANDTTASINGAAVGNGTFASGDGGLILTKPLSGHFGYVNLTITAPAYLQYNWNNTPTGGNYFDDNPQARATFGKFRNANEFIYLRENY